jgi:multidrug efflux pump subunit AcrA (membrane-fusion protein)
MSNKRLFWIIGGFIAIIAISGFIFFGGRAAQEAQAASQSGEIVQVFVGDLSAEASASGQIMPKREARLTMGITGEV